MEKPKSTQPKDSKASVATAKSTVPALSEKVPAMFRRTDWLTMAVTFAVIWIIYLFTLAPEQTLEDSGELCTGAFYAGIPHPPGYPFWSVYAWFWTEILGWLNMGNVAWRVEVGESFAAAMGCGLLALMVSRGSSMMMEGIEVIKGVPEKWENAICSVSGFVAGTLLGLDIFMWSEAVVINRISLFGVPWLIAVIACLMRWMYAPQQRRYLYLAMFLYGLCATIHQSLLLSAMGVEVAIALVSPRLGRDLFLGNAAIYLFGLIFMTSIPALAHMVKIEVFLFHLVGIGSIIAGGWLAIETKSILTEWKAIVWMGVVWVVGVCFYFYEPISCMTDPPMQWGYPRTVEGFFHALSRGQYASGDAINIFSGSLTFQLWYVVQGLSESFSWVYMFIGLLPFVFLLKMHKRERSWIIGLTTIYFCLSVLMVILLNVSADRSSSDLNKVFFTASHGLFAMMIGYGLTLLAAYTATHYQQVRKWGFVVGAIAAVLAIFSLKEATAKLYRGPAGQMSLGELPHHIAMAFDANQYALPVFASLILLAIPICLIGAFVFYRQRGPVLIMLVLFCTMPLWSGLAHWYKSEQRNHWYGFWFGHDMFTPPFTDPKTGKLTYDNDLRAQLLKDPANATKIYPEMDRSTILFGGTDPGRFCPTYSIFCDSFIPHSCQPEQDQKFDRRDCYLITQNALADGTYLEYLRAQYNRSLQHDPTFFDRLFRYTCAVLHLVPEGSVIMDGPEVGSGDTGNWLIERICGLLNGTLDNWFTAWGAHVEKARRARGVYPPNEIHIPSPAESQQCFEDYTQDVGRRSQLGQLDPGEDVHIENGRVQVSGQVAVMNINGLLCKVIFDSNPTNSFYVEESFPLKWMYPYETPFGIIMKINRNPLAELPAEVFKLDHEFWTKYSERLCGNWIDYNTSVLQIADFVDRTYIRNNYKGYIGARSFVRDDDSQKAFSKLRSSQAGMYFWRCFPRSPSNPQGCPPEYCQKTPASQAALLKETEFAFKQAFAFCPYSPEAVYRYVNFLLQTAQNEEIAGHPEKAVRNFDDAILVAETCRKLDPYNDQIKGLINTVKGYKASVSDRAQAFNQIDQMENTARTNPGNVQNLVVLGSAYMQMQQTNRAAQLFELALSRPEIKFNDAAAIAQCFAQMNNFEKLENTLKKMVALAPDQPEPRYDLAALECLVGKETEAMADLKAALEASKERLAKDPKARDLVEAARTDERLARLRAKPEFQKLVAPK
jgi:hypothetical protein